MLIPFYFPFFDSLPLQASINESILTLRQALFDDLGQNKDVVRTCFTSFRAPLLSQMQTVSLSPLSPSLPRFLPFAQSVGIAAPFLKYDRKGLDVTIEFKSKLSKEEGKMGGVMRGRGGGNDALCCPCENDCAHPAFHSPPPSLPSDLGL